MSDIDEKLTKWVSGKLNDQERETLEQQLERDPELKKEADFLAALRTGIQEQQENPPGDIGLARLKRDIQREQQQQPKPQQKFWKPLAIAACCLLGVQMFFLIPDNETDTGIVTLSGEASHQGPQLQVVFADGATAAQIQQALNSVQGNVISGPGALGIYTVVLPEGADAQQILLQLNSLGFVEEALVKQSAAK